ncbi:crossover junction endodeoxyribonuclease RuvC [Bacillus sp. NPDC077027]|uniref:crossover junction endodeoxyribonuclease RuvC n=1 Tax=Bacillus sp. NPDC077027 TaxID=3390548 RepID=UPI003D055D6E
MDRGKVILALDLSLTSTGYAVGVVLGGEIKLIEVGSINNKRYAKRSQAFRLHQIATKLKELYRKYEFDYIIKERGFVNARAMATQALFKVAGVADLISFAFGHEIKAELSPSTIKKLVTGDGRADKEKVQKAVEAFLGNDVNGLNLIEFINDDESDAVACLIAYCVQEKLIEAVA